jgi:hypothetical protein
MMAKKTNRNIVDEWKISQDDFESINFDSLLKEKEIKEIISLVLELNEKIKKATPIKNWRQQITQTHVQMLVSRRLLEAEVYLKSVLESLQKALEYEQKQQ